MTHIIIARDTLQQKEYLLSLVSKILNKEIKEADIYTNPDMHILDLTENLSIGIEEVKEFQKEMLYKPYQEAYQIAVVFNADKLTVEAQNSFLKTLEEQPDSTVFILLIKDEKDVLDTILSRGIKHNLVSKAEKETTQEVPTILSLELTEQFKEIEELCEKGSEEILIFLKNLQMYFKKNFRNDIINETDVTKSMKTLEIVNTAYERIKNNGNKKLVMENMVIQLSKL